MMRSAAGTTNRRACAGIGPSHHIAHISRRHITQHTCRPKAAHGDVQTDVINPTIVLYTKQDCPLCQGLQEKIEGLISRAQFMPCGLTDTTLEVRDIATDAEWQNQYETEVPVLTVRGPQGEVPVPRPPPRITADRLQKHLEQAIAQLEQ